VIGRVWTKVGSSCTVITMLTKLYTRSFTIDTMNHLTKTSLILVLVFLSQIGKSYSVIIYIGYSMLNYKSISLLFQARFDRNIEMYEHNRC